MNIIYDNAKRPAEWFSPGNRILSIRYDADSPPVLPEAKLMNLGG